MKPKTEPISLMDFAIDSADAVDGKRIVADTISPTKYLGPRSAFKTFATTAMTVITIAASNPVVQGSAALWAISGFPGIDAAPRDCDTGGSEVSGQLTRDRIGSKYTSSENPGGFF